MAKQHLQMMRMMQNMIKKIMKKMKKMMKKMKTINMKKHKLIRGVKAKNEMRCCGAEPSAEEINSLKCF